MSDSAGAHPAEGVLHELELVLAEERKALALLDRDAIESLAARKLELQCLIQDGAVQLIDANRTLELELLQRQGG